MPQILHYRQVHTSAVTHPTIAHQFFSVMEIETQTHKKQLALLSYQVHNALLTV